MAKLSNTRKTRFDVKFFGEGTFTELQGAGINANSLGDSMDYAEQDFQNFNSTFGNTEITAKNATYTIMGTTEIGTTFYTKLQALYLTKDLREHNNLEFQIRLLDDDLSTVLFTIPWPRVTLKVTQLWEGDADGLSEYELEIKTVGDPDDTIDTSTPFAVPTASFASFTETASGFTTDMDLVDADSTIVSAQYVVFAISDLITPVVTINLPITDGTNAIVESTLTTATDYIIFIEATYDINDGNGIQEDVELAANVFTTL